MLHHAMQNVRSERFGFFFTCKEKNNGEVSFSLPSTQKHFPLPATGWRKSWIELSHFEQKKERSLFSLQPLLLWSAKVGVQVMSRGKNTSSSIISCGCVNLGTYCLRSTFGKSNDHFALCNFSSTQWLYITIDGGSCFKKEAKSCLNCLTSRGRQKWLQKKRKVNDCFFFFICKYCHSSIQFKSCLECNNITHHNDYVCPIGCVMFSKISLAGKSTSHKYAQQITTKKYNN